MTLAEAIKQAIDEVGVKAFIKTFSSGSKKK